MISRATLRLLCSAATLLMGCSGTPVTAAGPPKSGVVPATATPAPVTLQESELLPGTQCTTAALPAWTYDARERRVRLSDGGFALRLPAGWSANVERPNIVIVSTQPNPSGVRPVFEVFVSPVCKTYDLPRVHERVAARGMKDLLPSEATAKQVSQGRWSGGLGGPVGRSIILFDVALKTPKGERILVLYGTDVGESKTVSVHAAAACPKERLGDHDQGACEKAYFEMLESME